jgi:gliding motility-associated protein GldE
LGLFFILSFFIAGSEAAFFSLTQKDINVLKRKKQPSYKRIVSLLDQPKFLSSSLIIAHFFVNLAIILIANVLMENSNIIKLQNFLATFALKLAILMLGLVLLGQILPRVWATHHKIWFAATASLLVEIIYSVFYRVSKRFVKYSEHIESKISTDSGADADQSNLDDAIDLLSDEEATIEEKQMLKGIRKFADTPVKQVMKTRLDVAGIQQSTHFNEVISIIRELHYSRFPVYKSDLDQIIGVLHVKDLLPFIHQGNDFDWHSVIRAPFFIHEQKQIEDLLQEFRAKRIHFAIVVDEFGGTSGIVTLEDIIEEITGEIKDEFDDEESFNKKIDDHNFIFEGKTMINDFCKILKIPVNTFEQERGDSDSLAGLILEIAGAFPQVNEKVVSGPFTFIPLEITKNRIEKIKVILSESEKNS